MSTRIAKEGNEVHVEAHKKPKGKRLWKLTRAEYDEMVMTVKAFDKEEAKEASGFVGVSVENETISVTRLLVEPEKAPAKK